MDYKHIEIYVEKGFDLPKRDFTGKSDPFLVFTLGNETVKSSIKYQTLSPSWNELLILRVADNQEDGIIHVDCRDWDITGFDGMGSANISLQNIKKDEEKPFQLQLNMESGAIHLTITARNFGLFTGTSIGLLGYQESGKSTFFKHIKLKSGSSLSEYHNVFYGSLLYWTKQILDSNTKRFKDPWSNRDNEFNAMLINRAVADELCQTYGLKFVQAHGVYAAIISIWKEETMTTTLKKYNGVDFNITNIENHLHFLNVESIQKWQIKEDMDAWSGDFAALLKTTLDYMKVHKINIEKEAHQKIASEFLSNKNMSMAWDLLSDPKVLNTLESCYHDYPEKIIATTSSFAKFLFLNYSKISKDQNEAKNLPDIKSLLAFSAKTTGFSAHTHSLNEREICVYDFGGRDSERKKWKKFILEKNISIVIFVVDLSCFDRIFSDGDSTFNYLNESVDAFEDLCKFFKGKILLFFNKQDLFIEKLKIKDLSGDFHDYVGGRDEKKAIEYIQDKFTCSYKGDSPLIIQEGSALQYQNIQACLDVAMEGIEKPQRRSSRPPIPVHVSSPIPKPRTGFTASVLSDDDVEIKFEIKK